MKTSAFLDFLRAHAGLPLRFVPETGRRVPPGYHLTEVKRVALETMDCGAQTHAWRETHFELWVSPLPEIRAADMPAGKFLGIVGRVEAQLPLDGESEAKVYFGKRGEPAALFSIVAAGPVGGALEVRLEADATRCKAAERRIKGVVDRLASCCSVPGCCDGETAAGSQPAAACCGDSARKEETVSSDFSGFPVRGLRLAF
jgi:hypothetical protein